MTPEDRGLADLLDDTGSDLVEFEESLAGDAPKRVREAICAFANDLPDHRRPGIVVVGAKDDGSVTGLPVTDGLLQRLGDMKTDGNILPPPSIAVERRSLRGRDVAVVTVQPSDSPPVRYRGTVQVRIGPRNGIATAQDERILNERRRYRDIPFDIHPVRSARLDDIDLYFFDYQYLRHAVASDVLEANERSREELMAAMKMTASIDDPTPTVLAILVLGKSPQDFLPGAYVQFLRFDGTEPVDDIVDDEDIPLREHGAEFIEVPVLDQAGVAVDDEEARLVTGLNGLLGDEMLRQLKVVIGHHEGGGAVVAGIVRCHEFCQPCATACTGDSTTETVPVIPGSEWPGMEQMRSNWPVFVGVKRTVFFDPIRIDPVATPNSSMTRSWSTVPRFLNSMTASWFTGISMTSGSNAHSVPTTM